jgi:hypothetical protein
LTPGDLDEWERPLAYTSSLVHHGCARNEYYEFKASAEENGRSGLHDGEPWLQGTQARRLQSAGVERVGIVPRRVAILHQSAPRRGSRSRAMPSPSPPDQRHPHRPAHRHAQGLVRGAGQPVEGRHAAQAEGKCDPAHTWPSCRATAQGENERDVTADHGPFNRVEGDLEVRLEMAGDWVEAARVTSPLYRGFEGC